MVCYQELPETNQGYASSHLGTFDEQEQGRKTNSRIGWNELQDVLEISINRKDNGKAMVIKVRKKDLLELLNKFVEIGDDGYLILQCLSTASTSPKYLLGFIGSSLGLFDIDNGDVIFVNYDKD